MPRPSDFGYFRLVLRGEENDYPALIDVSSLLYDTNLLYEFTRVIVDPEYSNYTFSRFSTYRNQKRIRPEDRLEIDSLRIESPIALIVIVAAVPSAAATLWYLVQSFEKIANFNINRDILKLQREKLRRELQAPAEGSERARLPNEAEFREQLHIRGAEYQFDRVEQHLQKNPVQVTEIDIDHVRELRPKSR